MSGLVGISGVSSLSFDWKVSRETDLITVDFIFNFTDTAQLEVHSYTPSDAFPLPKQIQTALESLESNQNFTLLAYSDGNDDNEHDFYLKLEDNRVYFTDDHSFYVNLYVISSKLKQFLRELLDTKICVPVPDDPRLAFQDRTDYPFFVHTCTCETGHGYRFDVHYSQIYVRNFSIDKTVLFDLYLALKNDEQKTYSKRLNNYYTLDVDDSDVSIEYNFGSMIGDYTLFPTKYIPNFVNYLVESKLVEA